MKAKYLDRKEVEVGERRRRDENIIMKTFLEENNRKQFCPKN